MAIIENGVVIAIGLGDLIKGLRDQKCADAVTGHEGERTFEKIQTSKRWKLIKHHQELVTVMFALSLETTLDDGSRVLGNIELKGKSLLFSVNSAGRAERGRRLIENTLGDLVRNPLTEIRTVKQMLEDAPDSRAREPESEVPPEIAEQLMKQTLDNHYRETLDLPVPALGDKTPRQVAKTKAGREQVIKWLKYLENSSVKSVDSGNLIENYDFSWIWKELGIKRPTY